MGNREAASDPAAPLLATQAEFARIRDVSRKTVTKWKTRGLLVMVGNRVAIEATQERMRMLHSSRSPKWQPPVTQVPDRELTVDDVAAGVDPEATVLCPEANTVSTAIDCGAWTMARLLCRYEPLELAKTLVSEWVANEREAYVGPSEIEPLCVTHEWPEPPSGGPWSCHPWFTRSPILDEEWNEFRADAATWRAERELPPL